MIEDDLIKDVKFEGGCSISLASASMMTEAIKGQKLENALAMSETFSKLMLGEIDELSDEDMGDAEALQGVSKFPARIKCATLAWKAMEKATNQGE